MHGKCPLLVDLAVMSRFGKHTLRKTHMLQNQHAVVAVTLRAISASVSNNTCTPSHQMMAAIVQASCAPCDDTPTTLCNNATRHTCMSKLKSIANLKFCCTVPTAHVLLTVARSLHLHLDISRIVTSHVHTELKVPTPADSHTTILPLDFCGKPPPRLSASLHPHTCTLDSRAPHMIRLRSHRAHPVAAIPLAEGAQRAGLVPRVALLAAKPGLLIAWLAWLPGLPACC